MKKIFHSLLATLLAALTMFGTPMALAQVPPHEPGTICVTASVWCWADPPGAPGDECTCETPYGPETGTIN
jgi:hypothetical protein